MDLKETKRRFRRLKALEIRLRYGGTPASSPVLIWDRFFDLTGGDKAKYSLETLAAMSNEECRQVIADYLSYVYSELFTTANPSEATSLLIKWGLPTGADALAVRKKFREMAKLAHPDTGGSSEAFIALMEEYEKLGKG